MSLLPEVKEGKIVQKEKKIKVRRGGLKRNKQNPRALGTNPRAKAKKLWREHFKGVEFIKNL